MDNCLNCLVLKEARRLKTEGVRFYDFVTKPIYCRACYQRERAENKRLKKIQGMKITDVIQCPNPGCCGCLIEKEYLGNVICNECGEKYKVKALQGKP